jgi:hypothetical protein
MLALAELGRWGDDVSDVADGRGMMPTKNTDFVGKPQANFVAGYSPTALTDFPRVD